MPATLQELANLVRGQVHGDASLTITAARPLSEAGAGDVTFIEDVKNVAGLHACKASAVVVPRTFSTNGKPAILVDEPLYAFVAIVRHMHGRPEPQPCGIDPRAAVHASVQVGADPSIHPFAVIGEGSVVGARCQIHSGAVVGRYCRLGDDVVLYPNVVVYEGTILGNRVILHGNAVIGADGFGYRYQGGCHVKVPQLGHVEIGDDVEIGACTTIDRGTFSATCIGAGSKIDNLVQIGHNCHIGQHNLFVSQIGVGGSTTTGDNVWVAGQVGINDHVTIGEGTVVGGRAGVLRDLPAGARVLGLPAIPEQEYKRQVLCLGRLPEMRRDLLRIKQRLDMKTEE